MGFKEDLFNWAFSDGVDKLQQRLDIRALQDRYNAKAERVLMFRVLDLKNTNPVYIQCKDGNIIKMPYHPSPDVKITFKHLDRFLDIIFVDGALQKLIAYNGMVVRGKVLTKEVWFEGDWCSGSIILQKVFEEYVSILREILNSSKFFRVVVKPMSKVKSAVSG